MLGFLLKSFIGNINACEAVADIVRTTLGPRGMDKLIYQGSKATISNDGRFSWKFDDSNPNGDFSFRC